MKQKPLLLLAEVVISGRSYNAADNYREIRSETNDITSSGVNTKPADTRNLLIYEKKDINAIHGDKTLFRTALICQRRDFPADTPVKFSDKVCQPVIFDGIAQFLHQPLIVPQVVNGVQPGPLYLVATIEMMQV